MHPEWQAALEDWRDWLESAESKLSKNQDLVPDWNLVMAAFAIRPRKIRVVILGQDPYPTKGAAIGLAFATEKKFTPVPASLRNIFQELQSDLGDNRLPQLNLSTWQRQGVWLLNRHLTALVQSPGAHFAVGWGSFTQAAIEHLLAREAQPMAFVLWGKQAQSVKPLLHKYVQADPSRFLILESAHPSPLSAYRGFFGSKPFSQVNDFLSSKGEQTVDWTD